MIMTAETEIFINGQSHDLTNHTIDAHQIMELFRSYVQKLELLSLQKNPEVQSHATKALKQMYMVLD